MTLCDYHAHTAYCDGDSPPRAMAEAALAKGLGVFGLSGHAPLPFSTTWNMEAVDAPAYLAEVRALSREFAGRMELLVGMEIDWMGDSGGPARAGPWAAGLDYRIGSVHFVRAEDGARFTVDSPEDEFIADFAAHCPAGGRPLVEDYYARIAAMALEGGFDILGHLDLPKKNNRGGRLFSESDPWYRDAVMRAVEAIASSDAVVEVNTGGISRKRIDEPYPSVWILKELRVRGVRAVICSDAHQPADILAHRDKALASLVEAGYRELAVLERGGWRSERIS